MTDVVKLVPRAEREREERDALELLANAGAIAMLERILVMARLDPEAGEPRGRIVGVVIAMSFADGSYGSAIPVDSALQVGALSGALADAQYRLIRAANEEDGT